MYKNIDLKKIYELYFEDSIDAQVLLDIELNKFVLCSKKVYDIYGYTKEEFLNITPYDLSVEFKDNISMENKQENILNLGEDKFITRHKTKDGKILNIFVKSKKIEYKNSLFLFITLVDLDKESVVKNYYESKYIKNKNIINLNGKFKWNKFDKILYIGKDIIELSSNEKELIQLLIKNINNIVSQEHILNHFISKEMTYNSLLSMIKRIRKKTSNNFIKTVYSKGYCLQNY